MAQPGDPEQLRQTFRQAASTYHAARPRYPAALLDTLERQAALTPESHLLEVGPASGVATEQLAPRGFTITAVELGQELADEARANLADHPNVTVHHATFESWEPPAWAAYDLVFAATAWHWVDPEVRYRRAHRHLRPGGSVAFWSANHVMPAGGDTFFMEIQPVYDEIGEALPDQWRFLKPGELPDYRDELVSDGLFAEPYIQHFDWEITYTADTYIGLLETFSGHISMAPDKRAHLYGEIRRRLAERDDGLLRRHWGAVLHVARAL